MAFENLQAIILAAQTAPAFRTGDSKLTMPICGQELILYPVHLLNSLGIPITLVVANDKEKIQTILINNSISHASYVTQAEPQGTANAVAATREAWFKDHILIMDSNLPLVSAEVIKNLLDEHVTTNAHVSFVIAHNEDPALNGYERIRFMEHEIQIVNDQSQAHEECCVNAGIYVLRRDFLASAIDQLNHHESFASIITLASKQNLVINQVQASFDEVRGVHSLQDVWAVEHIKRSKLIQHWMEKSVQFCAPHSVHIDLQVSIGSGSSIGAGVHLRGATKIGTNCTIGEFSSIENSTIGDKTTIHSHTIIKDSCVGNESSIGPFAHVRENCCIGNQSTIGNFVELKKTSVGDFSKAKHLTYLGDAHLGSQVNIGAGTITANHNGFTKQKTVIHDEAYIGANNTLVAPVIIESKSMTAAGSVITENVPTNALAIARSRQVNKEGYAQKLRDRAAGKSNETPTSFVAARKIDTDTSSAAD